MKRACLTSFCILVGLLSSHALSNETSLNQPSVLEGQYFNISGYAGNRDEVSYTSNGSSLLEVPFVSVGQFQSSIFHLGVAPQLMMNPSVERVGESIERLTVGEIRLPRLEERNDLENTESVEKLIIYHSHPITNAAVSDDHHQAVTMGVIRPTEEAILDARISSSGLRNERNDCFINGALQLLKTLGLPAPPRMPMLSRFLNNDSSLNCEDLRREIAKQVMAGTQEFDPQPTSEEDPPNNVVQKISESGTAVFQQDAEAFLRLLLEKLNAPQVYFQNIITRVGDQIDQPREVTESILSLALPADENIWMQLIIDNYLQDQVPRENTDIIREDAKLKEPVPQSLVFSIKRFAFNSSTSTETKRQDIINGVLNTITLPRGNGTQVTYEPKAIICHVDSSSVDSGHYICYRKEGDIWWKFNDDKVTQVTYEEDNEIIHKNCYVISYVRSNAQSSEVVTLPSRSTSSSPFSPVIKRTVIDAALPSPLSLSSESPVLKKTDSQVNNTKPSLSLTLEDFRKALVDYPKAERLIIQENTAAGTSLIQAAEKSQGPCVGKKEVDKNKKIIDALKAALKELHPEEIVNVFLPSNKKEVPPLSTDKLKEILEKSKAAHHEAEERLAKVMEDSTLINDFHKKIELFEKALNTTKEIKIDRDLKEWLENNIERLDFQLTKVNAIKAKLDEVLKVAKLNVVKCEENKERTSLDSEEYENLVDEFDFKQAIEEAQKAKQDKYFEVEKKKWEEIVARAITYSEAFLNNQNILKSEIANTEKTFTCYKQHKKMWLSKSLEYKKSIKEALDDVANSADEIFSGIFDIDIEKNTLSSARENCQAAYKKMEVAKDSFDKAKNAANYCLKNKDIHFFQDEDARPEFFEKAKAIWDKKTSPKTFLKSAKNEIAELEKAIMNVLEKATEPFKKDSEALDEVAKDACNTCKNAVKDILEKTVKAIKDNATLKKAKEDFEKNAALEKTDDTDKKGEDFKKALDDIKEEIALEKAVQAIISIQESESFLTEITGKPQSNDKLAENTVDDRRVGAPVTESLTIEKKSSKNPSKAKIKDPSSLLKKDYLNNEISENGWAYDALNKAFLKQRNHADQEAQNARIAAKELTVKLKEVENKYLALSKICLDPLSINQQRNSIEKSWQEAKEAAEASQKAWETAAKAITAAKDVKITWARNIFRLAGRRTGNFSLGESTKKDGEDLAELWAGQKFKQLTIQTTRPETESLNFSSSEQAEKKIQEEQKNAYNAYISNNTLKRSRLSSYKSKHGKYMMNFERRSETHASENPAWEYETDFLGNGHLTIINPHANDSKENSMSLKHIKVSDDQLQAAYFEKEVELKMEASILNNKALREQERIQNIKNQAKSASYDNSNADADRLCNDAAIIEKNQSKAWALVIEAYQKGLDAAPEFQKDYWINELKRVNIQSQIIDANGNTKLWGDIISRSKLTHDALNIEIERNQRAYDLLPEYEMRLKNYWKEQIDCLKLKKRKESVNELYYKASKAMCIAEEVINKAHATPAAKSEQAWKEAMQSLGNAILSWDSAIEGLGGLKEEGFSESKNSVWWNEALEAANDAKNQCIVNLQLCKAYSYDKAANIAESQQSWDKAIQKIGEGKQAWDDVITQLNKGLDAIPLLRKDLKGWWGTSLGIATDNKNYCVAKEFIYKANQAQLLANIANNKALEALDITINEKKQLWNESLQSSSLAEATWNEAIDTLRQGEANATGHNKVWWKQHIEILENIKKHRIEVASASVAHKEHNKALLMYSKAIVASDTEADQLLREAFDKINNAIALWNKVITECEQARNSVPSMLQKDFEPAWNQQLEIIKKDKSKSAILLLECETLQEENKAQLFSAQALISPIKEACLLWDKAIKSGNEAINTRQKILEKLFEENAVDEEIEFCKNKKNQLFATTLAYNAHKVNSMAVIAYDTACNASDTGAQSLWNQAILKRNDALVAWKETLEKFIQSLNELTVLQEKYKPWWSQQIEIIKNNRNASIALLLQYKANSIVHVDCVSWNASAVEQEQLWSILIEKKNEELKAWDNALKKFIQGLGESPESSKQWWNQQIEIINDHNCPVKSQTTSIGYSLMTY